MSWLKKLIVVMLLLPSLNCWAVTVRTYNSVKEMVSDKSIKNGDVLETFNYYDLKGGGGRYVVANAAGDKDFSIALKNGLFAVLQHNNTINVLQLGVKNDQSQDCSAIINSAIEKLAGHGGTLFFPIGGYLVSQIRINNSVIIRGDESSYWNQGTMFFCHSKEDMIVIDAQNVRIENIFFVGNQFNNTAIKAVASQNRSGLHINNVHVNKFKNGIMTDRFFLSDISYSRCANCDIGFSINNATSFKLYQTWALICEKGYELLNSTYLNLEGCCCDQSTEGYYIEGVKGIQLNSCSCEVSKELPLNVNNSTVTITNFVGYKNNTGRKESASLMFARNSVITMIGCCDKDQNVISCNNSVKLEKVTLSVDGCEFIKPIFADKKTSISGSYVSNYKKISF
mgnify:CR=1 FL=1